MLSLAHTGQSLASLDPPLLLREIHPRGALLDLVIFGDVFKLSTLEGGKRAKNEN